MKQNNIQIPEGYINSSLGIIPNDWEVKRLGEVFGQVQSFSFSRDQMTETAQQLHYIHYGDIHSKEAKDSIDLRRDKVPFIIDGIISLEKQEMEVFPMLNNGDILLTDASEDYEGVGKILEIINTDNKKIIGGLHTIVLRRKRENIFIGFGRYIFRNELGTKSLKRIAQGTKVYSISYNSISKLYLLLPPLPQQQKIAEILDTWDEAIEKQSTLIDKLTERKRGLMQQLLTGKKRLAGFNEEWKEVRLGEVLDYLQPTQYLVNSTDYNNNYKTPVLTAGKTFILGYTNEQKDVFSDIPVIIFDDFTTSSKFVDFPFKVKSSAMKILRARNNVNLIFAYAALKQIKYKVGGHERHWISKFAFLTVQIPSLTEQTAIANILTAANKEIELAKSKLELLRSQKGGLMQQLLSGKTRIKI